MLEQSEYHENGSFTDVFRVDGLPALGEYMMMVWLWLCNADSIQYITGKRKSLHGGVVVCKQYQTDVE